MSPTAVPNRPPRLVSAAAVNVTGVQATYAIPLSKEAADGSAVTEGSWVIPDLDQGNSLAITFADADGNPLWKHKAKRSMLDAAVADDGSLVAASSKDRSVYILDGDGNEQTGWTILYMHIESRDRVLPALTRLRDAVDAVEAMSPADLWPVPTYTELLFQL